MKRIATLMMAFALTGCACIDCDGPDFDIVRYEDKYLNCYGLLHAITEAETMLERSFSRCHNPYVFGPDPFCQPFMRVDSARARYNLFERVNYLYKLSETKGCTKITDKAKHRHPHLSSYPGFRTYSKEYYIPSAR